jgi:hypothetical protein
MIKTATTVKTITERIPPRIITIGTQLHTPLEKPSITYGINGIERKMINRIRFNKSNNTAKMKRAVGGSEATTSAISGGPLGVVTNLSGLKQVIKQAYGKNDANIVGKPNGLTNGKKDANPRLSDITLYTERGGSGRRFKLVPCINTKMS